MNSRFLFFCLAVTALLSSCGGSDCNTNSNGNNVPPAQILTLSLSSPQSYPAGVNTLMPVIVYNTGPKTLESIIYSITDNNTNSNLTIDEVTAKKCSVIAVGQRCQLNVLIPASSQVGTFSIQASNPLFLKANNSSNLDDNTFKASTLTGLTDVPTSDLTGINGVAIYYPKQIMSNSTIMVTMVVNSPNTGSFNMFNLVDASGNVIPYQVLTGNSGNGLSDLHPGDVVTLSIPVPQGVGDIAFYPELLKNGSPAVVPNNGAYKDQSPITIGIIASAGELAEPHGQIKPISQSINFESINTSQKIIIKNDGDRPITNLISSFPNMTPQPFTLGSGSTCSDTLQPQQSCYFVVNFDPSVKSAGSDSLNISYFDGIGDRNSTIPFTYRGTNAIADLSTNSDTTTVFGSTTTSPSTSHTITFTNNGETSLTLDNKNTINLPNDAFSYTNAPDGLITCAANLILAKGQSCSLTVTYTNGNVSPNNQGDIKLNYHYTDIDGLTTLYGSGLQTVSWNTALGQGILNMPTTNVNFSESHTSQVITINNSGNSPITNIVASLPDITPQPFTISPNSTCGNELKANDSCDFVIVFDSNVHSAGTDVLTISYNDGQINNSQTSTFSYRGTQVVAGLEITSPNNSNFDYSSTTNSPLESSIVIIKNTGDVPVDLKGTPVDLPSDNFSFAPPPAGYVACTNDIHLNAGESCAVYIVYNNNSVTSGLQSGDIKVDYEFTDIDQTTKITGTSTISTTWSTAQSQGVINSLGSQVEFGNILNNNAMESTIEIQIVNRGDANIPSLTPNISGDINNIYSIINNTCTNGLNIGESCILTIKAGPIDSTIPPSTINAQVDFSYIPYLGANLPMNATDVASLNTNVIAPRSAAISIANPILTAPTPRDGDGSMLSPYQMTNTDTAATLSYTITNTGPVPANNFSVRCIGSRRPRFNSYIPSLGAEGVIGSGWAVDTSLCNNINLAANNGSCTITVTNTNLTTGSNNFTPSCTMSWDDEDSPNGEQQLISQSTVYVSMSL